MQAFEWGKYVGRADFEFKNGELKLVNYQLIPNLNIYANLNNVFNKKYENAIEYGQEGRNVYVGLKGSF